MLRAPSTRLLLSSLALALCLGSSPATAEQGPAIPVGSPPCDAGWGPATLLDGANMQDVRVLRPDLAVAVGTADGTGVKRQPAWAWWDGTTWAADQGSVRGVEGLMGLAGGMGTPLWSVGFSQRDTTSVSIARRWTGDRWVADDPPKGGRAGELLVAADADATGSVWAVGMRASPDGVRTGLIWRRTLQHGWVPQTAGPPRSSFTGISALAPDDVWVVGSRWGRSGVMPMVRHWNGTAWAAQRLPDLGVEAVLTSITGTKGADLWAVGWRSRDGELRPLVLRRHAGAWTEVDAPALGGTFGLLLDVELDPTGRPWVGGAVYPADGSGYAGVVARRDGEQWTLWPRPSGDARWVSAVAGDPATAGWVAAQGARSAILRSVCEPPAGPLANLHARRRSGHKRGRTQAPVGHVSVRAGIIETRTPSPTAGLPRVPRLAAGGVLDGWIARDVATEAGLFVRSTTYGADVGDLNGDGHLDVFLSQHGGLPSLFLGDGSTYTLQPRGIFSRTDRHDCAIGQVAGGDLPDVVCSVGADGGMGLKVNELWLDPGSGTTSDVAAERGLADPVGRGRTIGLFDADGDGDLDLFLGNQGMRYDAQASPNRLMRNDGTGHFTWDPASGLGSDRGAECVRPVDIDRDGDLDLVVCGDNGSVVETKGLSIERNDGGVFHDVTSALGVHPIGEVDAVVGQLDGTGRPDLVQLSVNRIRIGLWSHGRFETVFERRLSNGRGLALGDIDGDGALDIYVQMGARSFNDPDVVLHNDGTGHGWTSIAVPSATDGRAQAVIAFDRDGDGRDDFLVLNGWLNPGPSQLISFVPMAAVVP